MISYTNTINMYYGIYTHVKIKGMPTTVPGMDGSKILILYGNNIVLFKIAL